MLYTIDGGALRMYLMCIVFYIGDLYLKCSAEHAERSHSVMLLYFTVCCCFIYVLSGATK